MENRIIKFRGWHTRANKMFSAEEMANDQLTLLPTGSFINVNSTHTSLSTIYDRELFIPLQFTGLHDKAGTEIYEGDIIKYEFEYDSDYDGDMPIVKTSKGIHHIKDIFDRYWIEQPKKEGGWCEVIGNIFQNPELLTR